MGNTTASAMPPLWQQDARMRRARHAQQQQQQQQQQRQQQQQQQQQQQEQEEQEQEQQEWHWQGQGDYAGEAQGCLPQLLGEPGQLQQQREEEQVSRQYKQVKQQQQQQQQQQQGQQQQQWEPLCLRRPLSVHRVGAWVPPELTAAWLVSSRCVAAQHVVGSRIEKGGGCVRCLQLGAPASCAAYGPSLQRTLGG